MALERHFEVKEKAQIKPDFALPNLPENQREWIVFGQLNNENAPTKISKIV